MVELCILNTCSFQSLLRLHYGTLAYVVQINLACVVHQRGKGKCLAAAASTVVENGLSFQLGSSFRKYHACRFDINSHRQQLAAFVLHLEMPLLILNHLEQVAFWGFRKPNSVRSMLRTPAAPAFILEQLQQVVASGAQGVSSDSQLGFIVHHIADLLRSFIAVALADDLIERFGA